MTERAFDKSQLRFRGLAPQIDKAEAKAAAEQPAKAANVSIRGIANTGAPMPDWLGSIALNLGGAKLHSDISQRPLPLLFEHEKPIGYVTALRTGPNGLEFDGQVIPSAEGAANVLSLAAGGYPWQCSLYAEPTVIRELAQGEKFSVNGRDIVGPGLVFEEWWLGEITLTAKGRDPMTSAGLAASKGDAAVRLNVQVKSMAEQSSTQPAGGGSEPQMTVDELRSKFPDLVKQIEQKAFESGVTKGMEVQKDVDAQIAEAASSTMGDPEAKEDAKTPEQQVAAVAASAIREGKRVNDVFPSFVRLGRKIAERSLSRGGSAAAQANDPRAARAAAIAAAERAANEDPAPATPAPGADQYVAEFSRLSATEQAKFAGNANYYAAFCRARDKGQYKSGYVPAKKEG